ncbi:LysR substrate-binding domain-containing protein [Emcibacter sp.]|uniref:LysR substrate-binding domain-containing protein n=1 Tax=Emcibacter sp. TaxID=1979954 RepID=UPI003A951AF3
MESKEKKAAQAAIKLPSRRALPPFEALRAFDAVARLGGVRKAAIGLDRDHAVISRHLRAIEAWTGCVLLERTSTGAQLTEEGRRYHKQISSAIDRIANATTDLIKLNENHKLIVWCKPGFALHWQTEHLADFEKKHPGIEIEIRPTDVSPDFSSHEADVDIRLIPKYGKGQKLPQGVKSMDLAHPPIIAVASPDYIKKHDPIHAPSDLTNHQLLFEVDDNSWKLWLQAHDVQGELELAGPRLWQGHLTLDAARHGRGIALTNYLVVSEDLAKGRLVEIGKDQESFQPHVEGIYLFVARSDRWDSPAIKQYRSWLQSSIAKELRPRKDSQPLW